MNFSIPLAGSAPTKSRPLEESTPYCVRLSVVTNLSQEDLCRIPQGAEQFRVGVLWIWPQKKHIKQSRSSGTEVQATEICQRLRAAHGTEVKEIHYC